MPPGAVRAGGNWGGGDKTASVPAPSARVHPSLRQMEFVLTVLPTPFRLASGRATMGKPEGRRGRLEGAQPIGVWRSPSS